MGVGSLEKDTAPLKVIFSLACKFTLPAARGFALPRDQALGPGPGPLLRLSYTVNPCTTGAVNDLKLPVGFEYAVDERPVG